MTPASGASQVRHPAVQAYRTFSFLMLLTIGSILLNGYHLGHQDQAVWLAAVKQSIDPGLYPLDSAFFLSHTQYSLFPQLIAWSVKTSGLPLDLAVFLWHALSVFLFLLASLQIARRVFSTKYGQWGAVAAVWAARLMVASGSKVSLINRYLHPRDLAVVALLFAFVAVLDGKLRALVWIALAAILHPTMAVIGACHLAIQAWRAPRPAPASSAVFPLALFMIGRVSNPVWRQVVASRSFLLPLRWHWYEWLGVIGPLAMLLWFARLGDQRGLPMVRHISRRVVLAGCLGVIGAVAISTLPPLERFIPMEPMRVLHFVYFCWIFLGGGLLGDYVLRDRPLRWAAFLVPILIASYFANALTYRASPQVEWPGRLPANDWVRAFDWARRNSPPGALFALNPYSMNLPGNDSHGFRAFAERSALADELKDRAIAGNFPELVYRWRQETSDLKHWEDFGAPDFERLAKRYGVSWVVLERTARAGSSVRKAGDAGLACPYLNQSLMVCEIGRKPAE